MVETAAHLYKGDCSFEWLRRMPANCAYVTWIAGLSLKAERRGPEVLDRCIMAYRNAAIRNPTYISITNAFQRNYLLGKNM